MQRGRNKSGQKQTTRKRRDSRVKTDNRSSLESSDDQMQSQVAKDEKPGAPERVWDINERWHMTVTCNKRKAWRPWTENTYNKQIALAPDTQQDSNRQNQQQHLHTIHQLQIRNQTMPINKRAQKQLTINEDRNRTRARTK